MKKSGKSFSGLWFKILFKEVCDSLNINTTLMTSSVEIELRQNFQILDLTFHYVNLL